MIIYNEVKFYSIKEASELLDISRPTTDKYLKELKNALPKNTWCLHIRYERNTERREKRPTVYISEYLFNIVKNKVEYKRYCIEKYNELTSNKIELKIQLLHYILKDDDKIKRFIENGGGGGKMHTDSELVNNLLTTDVIYEKLQNNLL